MPNFENEGFSLNTENLPQAIDAPPVVPEISTETPLLAYENPQAEKSIELQESPEHEQYHTVEGERDRHVGAFDMKFMELDWQMHQRALENLDPLTSDIKPGSISPQEASDFIWEERKKMELDFYRSLANPEEQEARREIREGLIRQLEDVYSALNQKSFTAQDEHARQTELGRVLHEKGIMGGNQEVENILATLYHQYGFRNKPINSKEQFITSALLSFDPLVFREAQQKVLGRTRESGYEQAFQNKFSEIDRKKADKTAEVERLEKEAHLKQIRDRLDVIYKSKQG